MWFKWVATSITDELCKSTVAPSRKLPFNRLEIISDEINGYCIHFIWTDSIGGGVQSSSQHFARQFERAFSNVAWNQRNSAMQHTKMWFSFERAQFGEQHSTAVKLKWFHEMHLSAAELVATEVVQRLHQYMYTRQIDNYQLVTGFASCGRIHSLMTVWNHLEIIVIITFVIEISFYLLFICNSAIKTEFQYNIIAMNMDQNWGNSGNDLIGIEMKMRMLSTLYRIWWIHWTYSKVICEYHGLNTFVLCIQDLPTKHRIWTARRCRINVQTNE